MKRFADYIQQIIRAKTISEFPAKKGFDYTVAIIQPELGSAEGIYRSLLPAMHLTAGTNIRCIPVGISEQQNSLSINQKQFEIKRALAEICNHIVFPFTSLPLADTIKNLREINPKLKFSYYVDYNYYYTPDSYPFSNEYVGAEAIAIIENNISLMNQVIVSNRELYKFLSMELSKKDFIKGKGIDICYQPFFFDKGFTADLVPPETKTKTKTRFGLVLNQYHFNDLSFIKGILKEFQKKHPEVEYVVLGWNGDYK